MSTEEEASKTLPSHAQMSKGGRPTVGGKAKGGGMFQRYRPASGGAARPVCYGLLAFLLLASVIALILYLVYRPSSPRFTVVGAAVYELKVNSSAAAATTVSTSMQFTLRVRNTNERSAVLYDRLSAYVVYRDQAITPATPLPPLYQEEDSTVAVSPVLGGGPVPASAEVVGGLASDQAYGVARMRLVMTGRVKYKAGPFRSAWYGLYVRCDLLMGLKKEMYGQVPLLGTLLCAVDA
ncbi:hypothetical protein Taro_017634 [Colocasia esculenta]|uniref:Late embryogenesis abundant protein LEA-2 subgroup domain-containing protein n=1 Tax=Colocasia esculenta TaxID=4460 RepID=A0A843UP66_COLES|nr:hypothetical protein [Colocasia esculenta]